MYVDAATSPIRPRPINVIGSFVAAAMIAQADIVPNVKTIATRENFINVQMVGLFVKITFILDFVCPSDNSFGVIVASVEALPAKATSAIQ